jgi:hypothetical protein
LGISVIWKQDYAAAVPSFPAYFAQQVFIGAHTFDLFLTHAEIEA